MFKEFTGRQAAGWGYGIFWLGLLIETVNTFHAGVTGATLDSPVFWAGQILTVGCTLYGIILLMSIRRRPW